MSTDVLVVSTRPATPRRVGGGLDDPELPISAATRHRRGSGVRPQPLAKRDTPIPPKHRQQSPPRSETSPPACIDRPPRRRPIDTPPSSIASAGATAQLATLTDELAIVVYHLAPVVSAPHADPTAVELARIAAMKLTSHHDCHKAWFPPASSLDFVRSRCLTLLSSLSTGEAAAVVSLLIAELGISDGQGVAR